MQNMLGVYTNADVFIFYFDVPEEEENV